jgi:phosphoribosylamine--glycine ligase
MKVLVVGSGARAHALVGKIQQDEGVSVIAAPGNGGIAGIAPTFALDVEKPEAIVALAKREGVSLVIVGPEAPLVAGAVDALAAAGIRAFGPSKAAAQLEGSKIFSKEFMSRHGIPTAAFGVFDKAEDADAYVRERGAPIVVKADGLAAGKGVVVASTVDEALEAIDLIMRRRAFGDAGARVLIEDCLRGEEVSFHVVSDGTSYVKLAPAQDHKRIFDGDRGPNTGGMGAYSPPPVVTAEVERKIIERVVEPTLRGMAKEGVPFRGALFVGLMIDGDEPMVLEYNTRFGDPECESIMTRWKGSVLPMLEGSADGDLRGLVPTWEAPASLCVVLAAGGYPGDYAKGAVISGLDEAAKVANVVVFHAGTKRDGDTVVTNGGRVLTVTAIGADIDEAAERAYRAADQISFEGRQMRRDIGYRARKRP